MRRRLLNLVVLLSVVLCVLLAAVWVRSYFVEDVVLVDRGGRRVDVFSLGGQIAIVTHPGRADGARGVRWNRTTLTSGTPYSDDRLSALGRFKRVPTREGAYTIFPHWPAVAAAGLPAGACYALRQRARRRANAAGGAKESPAAA